MLTHITPGLFWVTVGMAFAIDLYALLPHLATPCW